VVGVGAGTLCPPNGLPSCTAGEAMAARARARARKVVRMSMFAASDWTRRVQRGRADFKCSEIGVELLKWKTVGEGRGERLQKGPFLYLIVASSRQ
jgi:hypothetical protein